MMDNITATAAFLLNLSDADQASHAPYLVDDAWGFARGFEFFFLLIICVFGTLGNFTVIFSIILEKRVHQQGNIFVINLAIADLMVTGFVIPTVILNILSPPRTAEEVREKNMGFICQMVGYVVTVACTCSTNNLMLIALNRYLAIVHTNQYHRYFSTKRAYIMAIVAWLYSNALCSPTLLGWSQVAYDAKMQVCSWDDDYKLSYTYFLTIFALMVPMILTAVFYCHLFWSAKKTGRWVRKLSRENGGLGSTTKDGVHRKSCRRMAERERSLLLTLLTAMSFFYLCWSPYGLMILIDAKGVNGTLKKAGGWIGMSNSTVNFVIYGAMNACYRRGYRHLFYFIFKCERKSTYDSELFGRHRHLSHRNSNMSRSGGLNSQELVGSNSSKSRFSPTATHRSQLNRPVTLRRLQGGRGAGSSVYRPTSCAVTPPIAATSFCARSNPAQIVSTVHQLVSRPATPFVGVRCTRIPQDPEIMSRSSSEGSLQSSNSLLKKQRGKTGSSPKTSELGIEVLTRRMLSTKSLPSIMMNGSGGGNNSGEFFNMFQQAIKHQAHDVIINHSKKSTNS